MPREQGKRKKVPGNLEQDHKTQGQKREILHALTLKRDEYRALSEQETRRLLNSRDRERYIWGNKPSKHLARMVQKKKSRNFIEKIQKRMGNSPTQREI